MMTAPMTLDPFVGLISYDILESSSWYLVLYRSRVLYSFILYDYDIMIMSVSFESGRWSK
jgi:hypothetical protein